jgi:hypothetical protein
MRRLLVCFGTLLIATACGRGSTSGSPTGPNPPAPSTGNLIGRVTEGGTNSVFPIAGAVLTIGAGANAGKTATTNASGEYSFNELRRESFSVSISAAGYVTSDFSVDFRTGGSRRDFSLPLAAPRKPFSGGQFRVGDQILPGRYFTDPPQSGCYWERQRGFTGTFTDIIANRFVAYDGMQYIVDILASDVAFKTDPKCGTWVDSPIHGGQSSISAGVWLVGSQIAPGTYEVSSRAGCYWERLRHFQHQGVTGVIANSFSAAARSQSITIAADDVGFSNDANCGTWTRASAAKQLQPDAATEQSLADIERNRVLYERSAENHRLR